MWKYLRTYLQQIVFQIAVTSLSLLLFEYLSCLTLAKYMYISYESWYRCWRWLHWMLGWCFWCCCRSCDELATASRLTHTVSNERRNSCVATEATNESSSSRHPDPHDADSDSFLFQHLHTSPTLFIDPQTLLTEYTQYFPAGETKRGTSEILEREMRRNEGEQQLLIKTLGSLTIVKLFDFHFDSSKSNPMDRKQQDYSWTPQNVHRSVHMEAAKSSICSKH